MPAARAVFESEGFHAAGMEEVAARAGVSRVTVYQAFENKRRLMDAVATSTLDSPSFRRLVTAMTIEDPRQALLATIRAGCSFWAAHERFVACMTSLSLTDTDSAAALARRESQRREMLRALVERLASNGGLRREMSVDRATDVVVLLTSFAAFHELRRGVGLGVRGAADLLSRMLEVALFVSP
jgi:AcrR family transcriptional regulator